MGAIDVCADAEERFWSKVDKNGPTQPHMESPCWVWTAGRFHDGYGMFHFGTTVRAHRYCYKVQVGNVPDDMCVCHRCDNPACVRPDHFFLGSVLENIQDRVAKGRSARLLGEDSPSHLATEEDVVAIRERYAEGRDSYASMSAKCGLSPSAVGYIVTGKRWRHAAGPTFQRAHGPSERKPREPKSPEATIRHRVLAHLAVAPATVAALAAALGVPFNSCATRVSAMAKEGVICPDRVGRPNKLWSLSTTTPTRGSGCGSES